MTSTLDGRHCNVALCAGVVQLLARGNEPRALEALNRRLRVGLPACSAPALDGLMRRSKVIVDNVTSTVAEMHEALLSALQIVDQSRLLEWTKRIAALTPSFEALLSLLGDPTTMALRQCLLQPAELIAYLMEVVDALIRRSDTIVESINVLLRDIAVGTPGAGAGLLIPIEMLHRYHNDVPRLVTVVPQLTAPVEQNGPFVASEAFCTLLTSSVFEFDTVALVGCVGNPFVATYHEHRQTPQRLGPVSLVRVLYDPDVQWVAALPVDRCFGKSLNGNGKVMTYGDASTP